MNKAIKGIKYWEKLEKHIEAQTVAKLNREEKIWSTFEWSLSKQDTENQLRTYLCYQKLMLWTNDREMMAKLLALLFIVENEGWIQTSEYVF